MTGSLAARRAAADHPAAPTSLPHAGDAEAAPTGDPPARSRGDDPRMPSSTPPGRWAGLAARARAYLAAARPGWAGRALYAVAAVPLGALYLALFVGLFLSVVGIVYGIGVLGVLLLLAVTRGFAGAERRMARALLRVDLPDGERVGDQRGLVRPIRRLVTAGSTWRALGWLGVRVLLGAATLATLFTGSMMFAFLGWGADWNPLVALPLLALMACVAVLTVLVLDALVRLAAAAAPRLLGSETELRISALEQSTRRLVDRTRLARDLHDTIGHALTASLLQATAARRTLAPVADRPLQPEFARQALEHIETNTRTALAELDRVLTVLRTEDGGAEPAAWSAPALADLEGLLAGLRDGGLPVALVVDGDVDDVPPALQELAYRVVQEGTTNVLRHAGCPLTVAQVARSGDVLVVRVCNERASQLDSRPGPGGGRGLAGLRERTAAAGGTLSAEPTPSGGFELSVTLPLSGAV